MWLAMVLPILVTFVVGIITLMSAGNARSGAGATLRLFFGGAMIIGAGYAAITLISKLT
jgi:hypothetical protein